MRPLPSPERQARGGAARDSGRLAEVLAALWLMLHGWRVIGFRLKTHAAEIDILARRGGVLAVVEVKARPTMEGALAAVSPFQAERLRRAGADFAARRRDLSSLAVRLDMVALAPGKLPRHISNL